jgi:Neutral/alkaline non-lysosomal ceramidase, N-terminal
MMTKPRTFRHASFYGRIGIASADITPPVGICARNWGASRHEVARSIHRPLTLTAMTLAPAAGGQTLVLVEADLGGWKQQTFRDFFSRLHQKLSVEPANLIFALSHTHSAPILMDADESLPGSGLHRTWMKELFESTARTVRQSIESQFAGTIEWHAGRCGLAANRDLPDPNPSRDRIVCGYNPDGNPDDALLVGRIADAAGRVRATLVNYACHPTTLAWENEAISPDYVGAMRETIQQATNAPALFLLGACGELAPRYQYVRDPEVADRHGRELGFAALATLNGMEPPGAQLGYAEVVESGAPLAVWRHEPNEPSQELRAVSTSVALPIKNWPSAEELENQRRKCTDQALEERLRRKLNIRLGLGEVSTFELPVHVWRIGDAVLVGSCCEAYSVLQRELRRRFPDTMIACMNLINGSIGYLPPAELYDADVYAAWQTPFDRGSYERLLDTMIREIRDVLNG